MNVEGPLTRTVADAALMMNVMAGPDERDGHSLPAAGIDFLEGLGDGLKGLRCAYTSDLSVQAVDPEVAEITRKAAFAMEELGCEVVEDDPGILDMSGDLTILVISETATAHYETLAEDQEKMYPLFAPFISLVDSLSAVDFVNVQNHREDVWDKLWRFMSKYDLLLTPTTACAAFNLKEGGMLGPDEINGVPVTPASWIGFTYPFNFASLPAASVPCGFTKDGLPVGLQVVGRRYDEPTVLRAAAALEKAFPWADRHPDL
jgi:aspartyl-tRNA(Asn)/glutamyl-tRNA(Gln) amidotransferase subunit A